MRGRGDAGQPRGRMAEAPKGRGGHWSFLPIAVSGYDSSKELIVLHSKRCECYNIAVTALSSAERPTSVFQL